MQTGNILNANIENNMLNIVYRDNYFNYQNPSTLQVLNNIAFVIKNNKIFIGGTTTNETTLSLDLIISRYNLDGTIDNTFGVNGKLEIDISGNSFDILNDIQIDNDGNILVLALLEELNTSPSGDYLQPSYIIIKIDGNQNITNQVFNNNIFYFDYNNNKEAYLIIDKNNNLYLIDYNTIVSCDKNFNNIKYFENPALNQKIILDTYTNNLLYITSEGNEIIEYNNNGEKVYSKEVSLINDYQIYSVNSEGIIYQINYLREYIENNRNQEIVINKIIPNFGNNTNAIVNTFSVLQKYIFNTSFPDNIFDMYIDNLDNINIIFEEYEEATNAVNFILVKLDKNCNKIQQTTNKLTDKNAIYRNKKLQIDSNNNVYAFYAKNKLNYNAFEIYKFFSNYNIDNSFGTDGVMNNDIGNFIKEPIDMYFTNDKHILIGGTTFYNNNDFLITKINSFGELDKTFSNNGLLRLDNSGNIDIFFNIIEGNIYVNNIINVYFISGLSKYIDTYKLIFMVIDTKGVLIKKIETDLEVNNLYKIYLVDDNFYIFYSDNDDNYKLAIYNLYDKPTKIYNLSKFNMPQFLIALGNNSHRYTEFIVIFDSYKDNNLYFLKIYMYYLNQNTYVLTLLSTQTIQLNDYYQNINSIKKLIAFNKEFFSSDIYIAIMLNVANKEKFLLLNGIVKLEEEPPKSTFILNTKWNNNSGYISNTNYNIVPKNYKFDNKEVIENEVVTLFSRNLSITKIDIDSSLDLIIGGTSEADFSGNKAFLMKFQNNGYIKNINNKISKNSFLNSFIINEFNEIIYSTTPTKYISTYINSSELFKINISFTSEQFQFGYLNINYTYNDKDYSYRIQNKYLTIIELDKEKRIYNLIYNLSNYPNTLLTIFVVNSTINMYKYNDITRFLLSNNNILLRKKFY